MSHMWYILVTYLCHNSTIFVTLLSHMFFWIFHVLLLIFSILHKFIAFIIFIFPILKNLRDFVFLVCFYFIIIIFICICVFGLVYNILLFSILYFGLVYIFIFIYNIVFGLVYIFRDFVFLVCFYKNKSR